MTRPLPSGKKSVNLASPGPRVSRIRRDPPPVVKEKPVNPDEIDRRSAVIGVIVFALAIFVLTIAFSSYSGWSPAQYTLNLDAEDL
jgi:hypothetical protein